MNIFFDTETTGLKPGQICQLSVIIDNNSNCGPVGVKNWFFSVDYVEEGAEKVHGFSKEMLNKLSNNKVFADNKEEIAEIFNNNTVIAHNINFDNSFMKKEFERVNKEYTPLESFCTMKLFKDVLKIENTGKAAYYGRYKNPNLGEVVKRLNINEDKALEYANRLFKCDNVGFHDSRFDTTAMYIAVMIYRESMVDSYKWRNLFCR